MRPARPDAPLADDELEQLFAPLAGAGGLALAVSGGADSLALLVAVARWCRLRPSRPPAVVLTVDHGLRSSSRSEAETVVAIATRQGLPARLLRWEGPHPTGGIEAAARAARYRLLIAAAVEEGASHLLTAHQQEDQAETLLMRLHRGAHVMGLAGMRPTIAIAAAGRGRPLILHRPFLGTPRSRLAATAAAAGLTPIADPMNTDPRYLRARVREFLPRLAAAGIDARRLAKTAARMRTLSDAVEVAASDLLAAAAKADGFAVVTLDRLRFAAAPTEVQLRALTRIVMAVGGEDYPPRFASLEAMRRVIARTDAGASPGRRTLGGAVIDATDRAVRVYREFGRGGLPGLELVPGARGLWDGRFHYAASDRLAAGLSLRALGAHAKEVAHMRPRDVPSAAFSAVPGIFSRDRLVAVPSLGFSEADALSPVTLTAYVQQRLAEPPLFPNFGPGRG